MIFMGMGEYQPGEVLAFFDQIANVGQNQIDAGQMFFCRERHAEVDREPAAAALIADAIYRQVHADLADTAQRREHQFLLRRHDQRSPKPKTSPAVTVDRSPPCFSNRRPASSRPSKRPESSRSRNRTCSFSPRPAARLSQTPRIAAKPCPRFHCARRCAMRTDSAANSASGTTRVPVAARLVAG